MSKRIPPLDLMFLLTESANSPKHVGAYLPFKLPPGGGTRVVREIVDAYRAARPLPPFDFVADLALTDLPRWKVAPTMDMGYHVQHLALPPGSTDNDLLRLIEDLHEPVLDRNRPGFRIFVIEGLPGNMFAFYLKIHHAIVDGKSAMMRILASLNQEPGSRRIEPFFAVDLTSEKPRPPAQFLQRIVSLQANLRTQASAITSLYMGVLKKGLGGLLSAGRSGSVPFTAPRTPMNEPTRSARSFATLSLPLAEMRTAGKAFGGTLNDVAAAVVDEGLHRYLAEQGKSTSQPLVAMCPVSVRAPDDKEATTKASVIMVPLGKPSATIGERIEQVVAAIGSAKSEIRAMSTETAMMYGISAFALAEVAESARLSAGVTRPLANFVLSNVPGGTTPLYLNGARMMGMYPVSALGAGIGLNVTLASYADSMDFGFVANGMAMPDLPSLARHTGDAFADLRKAAGKTRTEAPATVPPRRRKGKRAGTRAAAVAPTPPPTARKGRNRRTSAAKRA